MEIGKDDVQGQMEGDRYFMAEVSLQLATKKRISMEKDVVCGMQVDPAKAAGTSQYGGKTYYFCSKGCQAKFDANPSQYVK